MHVEHPNDSQYVSIDVEPLSPFTACRIDSGRNNICQQTNVIIIHCKLMQSNSLSRIALPL